MCCTAVCLGHRAPALNDEDQDICETMHRGVRNIHSMTNTVYSCLHVGKKFSQSETGTVGNVP